MIMQRNNQTVKINPSLVLEPETARQLFEAEGGQITTFSPFGHDPFQDYPQLNQEREVKFKQEYPDFSPFFHSVVNGDYSLFCEGLLYFIAISKQLEAELLNFN